MSKKLEYIHGLTLAYLAGLQEKQGDIDRLAQNFNQEIREQKKQTMMPGKTCKSSGYKS